MNESSIRGSCLCGEVTFEVGPPVSLDEVPPMTPTDNIFWGSRAPWSCSSNGLPTHEEYRIPGDSPPEGRW